MVNLECLQKHYGLTIGALLKQIAKPLTECFGLYYFHYFKTYHDGTCISLTTHPELVLYRFQRQYRRGVLAPPQQSRSIAYALWDLISPGETTLFTEISEKFNIAHGITITKKNNDGYEFFHFATDSENKQINAFYLNEREKLLGFIEYFKLKHQKLIYSCEADKVTYQTSDVNSLYLNDNAKAAKHLFSLSKNNQILTIREKQILFYVAQGLQSKEVALKLNISYRTVEKHIENAKNKFECRTITQLIAKLVTNGYLETF